MIKKISDNETMSQARDYERNKPFQVVREGVENGESSEHSNSSNTKGNLEEMSSVTGETLCATEINLFSINGLIYPFRTSQTQIDTEST